MKVWLKRLAASGHDRSRSISASDIDSSSIIGTLLIVNIDEPYSHFTTPMSTMSWRREPFYFATICWFTSCRSYLIHLSPCPHSHYNSYTCIANPEGQFHGQPWNCKGLIIHGTLGVCVRASLLRIRDVVWLLALRNWAGMPWGCPFAALNDACWHR